MYWPEQWKREQRKVIHTFILIFPAQHLIRKGKKNRDLLLSRNKIKIKSVDAQRLSSFLFVFPGPTVSSLRSLIFLWKVGPETKEMRADAENWPQELWCMHATSNDLRATTNSYRPVKWHGVTARGTRNDLRRSLLKFLYISLYSFLFVWASFD